MNTAAWRRTIRLTALFVLLNVALGFCACLGDTPDLLGGEPRAVFTIPTHQPVAPEYGDDCDSCVCCAALLVTRQIRVEAIFTATSKANVAAAAAPLDPAPQSLKQPPRA